MKAPIDARAAADVARLLREAAQTEIVPRWRRLAAGDVRTKSGPFDLVTDADEAAERHIAGALRARFPGCAVIGEEATAADPGLLDTLRDAPLAFVVDPVDGTANFAAGLPLFGCMAAAIAGGDVIAAWIHDPIGDDTAIALRGEGAWIEAPDGRRQDLAVAPPVPPARMLACVSWTYLPTGLRERAAARLPRLGGALGFRCAAHEYRLAAQGHVHGLFYTRLMPWDHAPGWLLHREAGGHAAQFDSTPYSPLVTTGGLICAPDAASWAALRETLLG